MNIDNNLMKAAFAGIIFVLTLLSGAYPFRRKRSEQGTFDFPRGESLACGVFLGAALLHMLNDAALSFQLKNITYPLAYLLAGALFLIFLWFEHLGREIYAHRHKDQTIFLWIASIMLSIHSFLSGAALGLSNSASLSTILFIAIIAHKWAESFAIAVLLNKVKASHMSRWIAFSIFAVMTPVGVFTGGILSLSISEQSLMLPIFSSLAAGTFLYLGTLHGLDKGVLVRQCCNLRNFSYVIIGFSIMAVVAIYN